MNAVNQILRVMRKAPVANTDEFAQMLASMAKGDRTFVLTELHGITTHLAIKRPVAELTMDHEMAQRIFAGLVWDTSALSKLTPNSSVCANVSALAYPSFVCYPWKENGAYHSPNYPDCRPMQDCQAVSQCDPPRPYWRLDSRRQDRRHAGQGRQKARQVKTRTQSSVLDSL